MLLWRVWGNVTTGTTSAGIQTGVSVNSTTQQYGWMTTFRLSAAHVWRATGLYVDPVLRSGTLTIRAFAGLGSTTGLTVFNVQLLEVRLFSLQAAQI
jgi:hypothetical protein